ncbi:MAG: Npt1/Npt2 family nucleotide transporter [Myxococcota bacterium]
MIRSEPHTTARLVALLGLAFVVMGSYGLARPTTESLFLAAHSAHALPSVWLAVAVMTTLVVGIYNRYASAVRLVSLFGAATLATAAILVLLLVALDRGLAGAAFALYVWKDIYVIVLVEIFWSFANAVFEIRTARWIYGLVMVAGSLGGVGANLATHVLAARFGTVATLWLVVPMLLLVYFGGRVLGRTAHVAPPVDQARRPSTLRDSVRVLSESRYLTLLLVLIAVVQVVITLVDYQYNALLEQAYPQMDERTGIIGRVYAIIDGGSMLLQLATGPVLRATGVPVALLIIPIFLGSALAGFLAAPRFLSVAVAKVASKVFDYSVFRAAKEILYIPLSYAEKTQGKALIDMMTYRVAKGGASLLLLLLAAASLSRLSGLLALALILVWWGLTLAIVRRYRRLVSREDELAPRDEAAT